MLKIGLTGGIGSGKSQVATMLGQWGAHVIDTDAIAHQLTSSGGAAIPAIRDAFGAGMIQADGALDRAAMRQHVFADEQARKRLEAILHPQIADGVKQQAKASTADYLVFVVPLLIESGRWSRQVDRICVVDCDPETQIARVQKRSGLTREAIERIMSAQASRAKRLQAANDIIINDGQTTLSMLQQQTLALHRQWHQMATCAAGRSPRTVRD